ncbi:MAG TPA: HNH endonuclease [Terriglobales bacterium]|nr:HNH endonuclease [Terriglobales bacterium]
MTASGDRFYQLDFRHRSVLHGDVGSMLRIEGIVVGGGGAGAILLLPGAGNGPLPTIEMTGDQWSEWLQRSDVPEILVSEGGLAKAFHRKVRYEISGFVQQRVWVADGFKCMYCERPMGEVQLTIDHWMPLEMGGVNGPSNYLSACRKCNKDKGSEDPKSWCDRNDYEYQWFVDYLGNRKVQ